MSQDVFQAKLDRAMEGIDGVVGIGDDLVIAGDDDADHDNILFRFMQRCRDVNLRLNFDKAYIKQPHVKFYGLICGQEGVNPDPSKMAAVKNMRPPTCTAELQSFIRLVTYMSPFIKNASDLTAPLRELVSDNSEFSWSASHQEVFDKVKVQYLRKLPLVISTPASPSLYK